MNRKRITERFPWLIPLRKKQRLFFFYLGMKLDRHTYCHTQDYNLLPYSVFSDSSPLYNSQTGFDMVYQENKVFNLKLAAKKLNYLVIHPGETFSFCQSVRKADQEVPYKEGLIVVNGTLTTAPGGGLCQMSNLLFWLFLHSPLTIVERHGHAVKDFPDPPGTLMGVDATISEGWLDLKVKNETSSDYQIVLSFDDSHITGTLLSSAEEKIRYEIKNEDLFYFRKCGQIFQQVSVLRTKKSIATGESMGSQTLYKNECKIGYSLPDATKVIEKG